jgi:hypothetical protein
MCLGKVLVSSRLMSKFSTKHPKNRIGSSTVFWLPQRAFLSISALDSLEDHDMIPRMTIGEMTRFPAIFPCQRFFSS